MDTLSTTTHQISSLIPLSLIPNHTKNNKLLKPPPPSNPKHHFTTTSTLLNNKTNHASLKPISFHNHSHSPASNTPKPALQTHRKATTGYAAALLDAAYCDVINKVMIGSNLVAMVQDAMTVKRIVKAVLEDEMIKEEKKGDMIRKVMKRGDFYEKLVVLVKMLVAKGKVRAVEEVMDEFVRLWEDLCGVQRVIVVKEKHRRSSLAS